MSILTNANGKAYITQQGKALRMNRSIIYVKTKKGATVTCGQWSYVLSSNQDTVGFNIEPDTYVITASKTGYKTKTTTLTVEAGIAYNISLNLFYDGYTELQYIESTGIQYIDTGWLYDVSKLPLEFDIKANYPSFTRGTLFGLQSASRTKWLYPVYTASNTSDVTSYFGDTSLSAFFTRFAHTDYTIHIEADSTNFIRKVNNEPTLTNAWNSNNVDTSAHLLLFAGSFGTDVDDKATTKIYYFTIKENGVLVRNFIPAKRDLDNVVGMYDAVTNTFYYSAGTGNFIAGPEV